MRKTLIVHIFITLILTCFVTLPAYINTSAASMPIHSYTLMNTSEFSVSVLKEFNQGSMVARLLQINNETIALAGTNTWRNQTWNDTQGNTKSFDAEWAKIGIADMPDEPGAISNKIDSQTFYKYFNESCHILFMSKYNGTHFSQAILVLNTTSNVTVGRVGGHVIHDDGYDYLTYEISSFSGAKEVNRTTYFANSTDSIYNPTRALYNAILVMRAHNYTFMSVDGIFIIPQEFIPREFNTTAQFLWYIKFNYYGEHSLPNTTSSSTEGNFKYEYEYRTVMFPNGTLLRLNIAGGPIVYPCGNCKNTFYTIIIVAVAIVLVPLTFLALWRRKRHKKLLQEGIQTPESSSVNPSEF